MQQTEQQHKQNQQRHQLSLSNSPTNRDSQQIKQIGNYILNKTIGRGTFGKVKLGVHTLTNEKVAIKILEKRMIQGDQDMLSVQSEISILKSVNHPNISQLYQIIETNDCLYLVLEYAQNGELFDFIVRKRRLTEQETCLVFAQILNALEYLHDLGISHRDLKPENLLFDYKYELKLVDFGLSKICQEADQQLYTCCGSPCYASPETISSQPYVGRYVDLWSCGIILFAMLCGYLPFDDDNQASLFAKIISCEYYIPTDISPEASYLIRGLLKKDPNQRLSIKDIKNSAFYQNYMQGTQVKPGIRLGIDFIYVDEAIIEKLSLFGIEPSQARQSIIQNHHNSITATYYLLKIKFQRNYKQLKISKQKKENNQQEQANNDSQKVEQQKQQQQQQQLQQQQQQQIEITSSPKQNIIFSNNSPDQEKLINQNNQQNNQKQQNQNQNQGEQNLNLGVAHKPIISQQFHASLNQSNQDINIQQYSSSSTQNLSESKSQKQNQEKQKQRIKTEPQQNNSKNQFQKVVAKNNQIAFLDLYQKQIELNTSNEEYYNGSGVQNMRNAYVSALGNYQNQLLQISTEQESYNLNQVAQIANLQAQSPYNTNLALIKTVQFQKSNAQNQNQIVANSENITPKNNNNNNNNNKQKNSENKQLEDLQQNNNQNSYQANLQQQASGNLISNIPLHVYHTNIQSKKTSQVDISTQKYFKYSLKKRNLCINEYSVDNAKNYDQTPSPKDPPIFSVSQDTFYQKAQQIQQTKHQKDIQQPKVGNQLKKHSEHIKSNVINNNSNHSLQKQIFYLNESDKKIETIKKIIDSVRSTKNSFNPPQQITPRMKIFSKIQNSNNNTNQIHDIFSKRKSVPLYLSPQKEDVFSSSQNEAYRNIFQNNQMQSKQQQMIEESKLNQNNMSNQKQLSNKSVKTYKTLNPSMVWQANENLQVKSTNSERNPIVNLKQKNSQQNTSQSQSQSLLNQQKDNLLYYPDFAQNINKKSNKLQLIFNNSSNKSESNEKKQINNIYFHHQSNNCSSHIQASNLYQSIQTKQIQLNSSSTKACSSSHQLFQSEKKQNQNINKKKNQISNISKTQSSSSQLIEQQQFQNQEQLAQNLIQMTSSQYANPEIASKSYSFQKLNILNHTNSTCEDGSVMVIQPNEQLMNSQKYNEDIRLNTSEEKLVSVSVHKHLNLQESVKRPQTNSQVSINPNKNGIDQLNIIQNFEKSSPKNNNYSQIENSQKTNNNSQKILSQKHLKVLNNQLQNGMSQINTQLFKKYLTLNTNESKMFPQQLPQSTKSVSGQLQQQQWQNKTQQQSPIHNNFFQEKKPKKQLTAQQKQLLINNKTQVQKRFLFDQ
ncbi:Serine/Threonine kinase domain protein (macronuclear) [Tetrahymena thermophila SB210]|uniref:Serine/Threonine kinase domain protein n=1 Tax=Tetrahymena thermophila (strain SB210) TaxID=312017 RepID=Q240T9_TETTS|nr:Serine/Threonine kinase domain protein [Tetrahymena thermophila SB210]EAS02325.3 Serine/Threonine kinase domain protein [Tetrahymena thermophila SB210]|eukprot:XP_001022570.3 Serine/Threonine kinase domain protein [Tetrahymena thermophila SB210]